MSLHSLDDRKTLIWNHWRVYKTKGGNTKNEHDFFVFPDTWRERESLGNGNIMKTKMANVKKTRTKP